MTEFNAEIIIQLDWSEMDLFGHINNVAYYKYMQAARVSYIEGIGINTYKPEDKKSFAVAASSCQFKQPLYYPGHVVVKTKVEWIKNTSFQLIHYIFNNKGELCAEGMDVIVLFDYNVNQKMEVSDVIRERISSIEKKSFN